MVLKFTVCDQIKWSPSHLAAEINDSLLQLTLLLLNRLIGISNNYKHIILKNGLDTAVYNIDIPFILSVFANILIGID